MGWTRLRVVLAVCLAAWVLLFAPVVSAQPAVAQKQMLDGDRAAQAGKWQEALTLFQKAHEASPSAATASRIANALYKLGREPEAYDAYEALLKDRGASLFGADKKTATDRLAELKTKTGSVNVRVGETGATVSVDGVAVGSSPLPKPVRVKVGSHKIVVSKEGFAPFESTVDVAGNAALAVDAKLVEAGAKVSVAVKGGDALQIIIDGKEAGPAPFEGVLPPGVHTIAGRSLTASAAAVTIEVKNGVPATVELVASRVSGTLDVRVETPKSQISVDGQKVGEGLFKGELSEGEHQLEVTAEGYEPFSKKVKIIAGEVVAETVTLHKATVGTVVEPGQRAWAFDGLYGGLQIIGMFEPAGSGNTIGTSCEVTGATTCEDGLPKGGALAGYIGYAFAPVGLELFILAAGDATSPHASFDGSTGSEVNPLVSKPAREEDFIIGRFGGGGAVRLRLLVPIERFRITGAIGAGLAYRRMLLGRDTVADNGATSSTGNEDGDGYVTGVLSIELAGQVLLGGTTSFVLGANLWLEHAGDGLATPARTDIYLTKDGEVPQPQATPSYNMASGTQAFIGPFIGLHFGP